MRRLVVPCVLSCVLAAPILAQPQPPVFRSANRTVVLHATVRSADGRLVPHLPREVFSVSDNGRPVEISVFSNDPQPLTVALLVDVSGSMEPSFLRVREATREFIQALQPDDRVRIGTFGAEVALSPHLTGDRAILLRILNEEMWPGGATPMWNATLAAMASLADEPGRRVILILTDGDDSGRRSGFDGTASDARTRAIDEGFMIYAIGVEGHHLHPDARNIADETGGGYFHLASGDDLIGTFRRVVEELRHQYLIGFTPPALDGKRHRVDVKLSTPRLNVRARRSYVAPIGPALKKK